MDKIIIFNISNATYYHANIEKSLKSNIYQRNLVILRLI